MYPCTVLTVGVLVGVSACISVYQGAALAFVCLVDGFCDKFVTTGPLFYSPSSNTTTNGLAQHKTNGLAQHKTNGHILTSECYGLGTRELGFVVFLSSFLAKLKCFQRHLDAIGLIADFLKPPR